MIPYAQCLSLGAYPLLVITKREVVIRARLIMTCIHGFWLSAIHGLIGGLDSGGVGLSPRGKVGLPFV